jgi:hypothetical protein
MVKDLGRMSAFRALSPEHSKRFWAKANEVGWSYNWAGSIVDQLVPSVVS